MAPGPLADHSQVCDCFECAMVSDSVRKTAIEANGHWHVGYKNMTRTTIDKSRRRKAPASGSRLDRSSYRWQAGLPKRSASLHAW